MTFVKQKGDYKAYLLFLWSFFLLTFHPYGAWQKKIYDTRISILELVKLKMKNKDIFIPSYTLIIF